MWLRIIKSFRGLDFFSGLNLFLSAFLDIITSIFTHSVVPCAIFSGLYLVKCKNTNCLFYVRGGTDDIYHVLPGREGPVESFILSIMEKSDGVFVDVGANIGYYTILIAKKGSRVIAVEPIPETVKVLKTNVVLNNVEEYVTVVNKCATSQNMKIKMFVPINKYYGLATIYKEVHPVSKYQEILIPGVTLDSILSDFYSITLIKIDVEGAEFEVLKGLNKSLKNTHFIVIELSRNIPEVIALLKEEGFSIRPMGFTTYILAYRSKLM
ncbi:MAG: FkbM family methyltransferase [Nitrososphaerota archaeon]